MIKVNINTETNGNYNLFERISFLEITGLKHEQQNVFLPISR